MSEITFILNHKKRDFHCSNTSGKSETNLKTIKSMIETEAKKVMKVKKEHSQTKTETWQRT